MANAICLCCGALAKTKFCSLACALRMPGEPRPCERCHKMFQPRRIIRPARYCSDYCRNRVTSERADARAPMRQCAQCGRTFQDRRRYVRYCGHSCGMKAVRLRQSIGLGLPMATCLGCGKPCYRTPGSRRFVRCEGCERSGKGMPRLEQCAACGKEITAKRRRVFCSYRCGKKRLVDGSAPNFLGLIVAGAQVQQINDLAVAWRAYRQVKQTVRSIQKGGTP